MGEHDVATGARRAWGGCAWLALVAPIDAARFGVDDERIAATLRWAGGSIGDATPDVEVLLDPRNSKARARRIVTSLSAAPADRGPWMVRRTTRVLRALHLRARAIRASRYLRLQGYPLVAQLPWEPDGAHVAPLDGWRAWRSLGDVLPKNLLVVADRDSRPATTLDGALECAAAHGRSLVIERVLVRDTSVIVLDPEVVLRVELGAGRSGVERQVDALRRLGELQATGEWRAWTPRLLGHGTAGLAAWSLEERLAGSALRAELVDGRLMDQCVDFLLALAGAWQGPVAEEQLTSDQEAVLSACADGDREGVRSLTQWIASVLSGHPARLAHGDFFCRNILVEGSRLTGVVDWERSTTGRPPLHDAVHFRIAELAAARHRNYGPAAVAWAESAEAWRSDAFLARYSDRLGFVPDTETVVAVAAGCWLAQVAHQLVRVAETGNDPAWVAENLTEPALRLQRIAARYSVGAAKKQRPDPT